MSIDLDDDTIEIPLASDEKETDENVMTHLKGRKKKLEIPPHTRAQENYNINDKRDRVRSSLEDFSDSFSYLETVIYNAAVRRYKKLVDIDKTEFCKIYTDLSYQVLGKLIELDDGLVLDDLIIFIKDEKWDSIHKERETYTDTMTYDNYDVEEGIYECGKCKSRKTKHYSLQLRRSDEPSTIFITCLSCGEKWKQSG